MSTTRAVQILAILTIVLRTLGPFELLSDEPRLLTGKKLFQDLDELYAVNLTRTDLRQFVDQASADRHISIVVDRRLDTSAAFPLIFKNASLQKGLSQIARLVDADLVVFENLVYLGPRSSTSRLRTLAEIRKLDLSLKDFVVPEHRRSELLRRQTVAWGDLESPREILEAISLPNHLTVSNIELIPHDLWPAATVPESSLIDVLSIILIQFDLTFRWKESGKSIELVPIPDRVAIEKKIRPKQKLSEAVALVRQRFPDLDVRGLNSEVVVSGLVEDCEAVEALLNGKGGKRPVNAQSQDLRKEQLGFATAVNARLIDIINKLEDLDIQIEYDADEMKDHGIDLEQLVQVDAGKKPAEKFFKDLFGPAKIDFEIEQSTVKLKPKKRR